MNFDINKKNNKKRILLPALTIIMFLGISLAAVYFVNVFNDTRTNELVSGLISIDFTEGSEIVNLENQVPVIDEIGLENTPYTFTVKNTSAIPINLRMQLVPQSDNTILLDAIRYAFYIDDELIEIGNVDSKNDNTIYIVNNFKVNETINGKLVFWVDYYYENANQKLSAKLKVTGESFDIIYRPINEALKQSINNSTCNPSIKDDDGTIYLSGTNECVNFNYVWYSGKLWRITAINPDGSMKLISEDPISSMNWGATSTVSSTDLTSAYSTSYMNQWLNQEFLPTLYDYESIIVDNAGWYSIVDSNEIPTKPTGNYTLTSPVGLLNKYEYYMAHQNASELTSYLNNGYYWWTMTPYDATAVTRISSDGVCLNDSPYGYVAAIRPSIVLRSSIDLVDGTGTIENPYKIRGDKDNPIANTTLLNTRSSGEFVKLINDETEQMFRIVETEKVGDSLTTKLVLNDYVRDRSDIDSNGNTTEVLKKYFSNSTILWNEVDKTDTTYWRGYLNNTWVREIDNTYNKDTKTSSILAKGTYYLGAFNYENYKITVCSTISSEISIKKCIENGTTVSNKTSEDYVGLLRVGEIFATQIDDYTATNAVDMWTLTPGIEKVHINRMYGTLVSKTPTSDTYAAHPTINLKSEIVIKSGSGTKRDPFVVGLS